MRRFLLSAITFTLFLCSAAPRRYPATGLVLAVDPEQRTITISHQAIPGLMDAMAMPFHVQPSTNLATLHPGDPVAFTLSVDRNSSWASDFRVLPFESAERDPALASRLKTLDNVTSTPPAPLALGDKAAFALLDQNGQPMQLAQFAGKVVVIDFLYTRCPLPDYCFRLSTNFSRLQKRFHGNPNLVLLTITFDSVHDGPAELSRYARLWKAEPQQWHFLTGSVPQIQMACAQFGVGYWPDDGVFTHSLHTAILDRDAKLVANLEGNRFTAAQLGDLVETVLLNKQR